MSILANFKYFLIAIFCFFTLPIYANNLTCFVIGKKIRPYIEMLNGFYNSSKSKTVVYDLSDEDITVKTLNSCNIVVSCGTKANNKVSSFKLDKKKIYTFFIYKNESQNYYFDNLSAGVYLFPEPELLIEHFKKYSIKKIFAPFSEKKVKNYLENRESIFTENNILLFKEYIQDYKTFNDIFQKFKGSSLWILPDILYSSKEFIDYVIKNAILSNIKVIGFNRYFYKAGANYSIIIDYKKIGKIVAEIAEKNKKGLYNAPFLFIGGQEK